MDIVFSSTDSPIKIHPAITINDDYNSYKISYKIDTKECHILTLKSTKFIALYHAGVIHIFNLETEMKFPDDFKEYIQRIKDKLIQYFTHEPSLDDSPSREQLQRQIINDSENDYDFVAIGSGNCSQTEELDLSNAKEQIQELNVLLQRRCPDFYLRIDYLTSFPENSNIHLYDGARQYLNSFYTFPNIVLCLFTGNDCVSSITMHLTNSFYGSFYGANYIKSIFIESFTSLLYTERKFNKLLRAVAIIISKKINPTIVVLKSTAANPLSARIMVNSFNATFSHEDKLIGKNTPDINIDDLIKSRNFLQTYVDLNDQENIANAKRVFMEIIDTEDIDKRIKCDKLQDETAVPLASAAPAAPAAPPLAPAAPPLTPAQNKSIIESQPHSRSKYYRTLGINFGRGGKQTKKRSNHKRSGHKRSGHKRSGHKRSNHKRSNHKRSNHKRSNHKRSDHKRSDHKRTYKVI